MTVWPSGRLKSFADKSKSLSHAINIKSPSLSSYLSLKLSSLSWNLFAICSFKFVNPSESMNGNLTISSLYVALIVKGFTEFFKVVLGCPSSSSIRIVSTRVELYIACSVWVAGLCSLDPRKFEEWESLLLGVYGHSLIPRLVQMRFNLLLLTSYIQCTKWKWEP